MKNNNSNNNNKNDKPFYYFPPQELLDLSRNEDNTNTIWIGNLSNNVDAETLTKAFSRYGKVSNSRIIPSKNELIDHYGFIDIESDCIEKILNDEIIIDDVKVKARLAKHKPSARSQKIERYKKYLREKLAADFSNGDKGE